AVLEGLVGAAERVLGQTWVTLAVEAETGVLRVVARSTDDPPADSSRVPAIGSVPMRVGERLVGHVAGARQTLALWGVEERPAAHPSRPDLVRWGMRSLLLVPVVTNGVVRAILAGSIHDDSRQFNESDLRLAQAVADRAATALENARLFEELTRAYQELKTAQEHLVQTEKLR